MTSHKRRIDLVLVERGLFDSRARAHAAIKAGGVVVDGRTVVKASEQVEAHAAIAARAAHPYVSRGALKLIAALEAFEVDPAGQRCLDVGASTGGFTQLLLERSAAHVTAVDVGTGQMHPSLRHDSRVTLQESRDARSLVSADMAAPPELIVVDVSFISLGLILPHILTLAAPAATLIALIKPQFEAGRAAVSAGKGVIRDVTLHRDVCDRIGRVVGDCGWTGLGIIASPIAGGDGNAEFLIGATRTAAARADV